MVIVTGGIGFIGSHICRLLLESGREVTVLDNVSGDRLEKLKHVRMPDIADRLKFIQCDITDYDQVLNALKDNPSKEIIHTAAITFIPTAIKNPTLTFKVNTLGTFNLLEASRILDMKKFVYISTVSTYGDFKYTPANEDHPLQPKDIYGATKAAADSITSSYNKTYNLPTAIVRTSSVYGPGDMERRAAKAFIENALQGIPMELQGGGTQRRDFSYVKDVANGIVLVLESEKANGEVFNITSGSDYSIKDLAMAVNDFIPGSEIKEVGARKMDVARGELDISKAKNLLGYSPKYDLNAGLKEYIKWVVEIYAPAMGLEIKNKPVV